MSDTIAIDRTLWLDRLERIESLARRVHELETHLAALCDRLDEIAASPAYRGVWGLYAAHGGSYDGPSWEEPLKAARACLR